MTDSICLRCARPVGECVCARGPDAGLQLGAAPRARPSREVVALRLAADWSLLGTCVRRRVGCVLFDADGFQLSSGYNGPAAGEPHCADHPCPGADCPSGTGLDECWAIHAEVNALIRCPDPRRIHTAYVTDSPCVHCVKALLNTACRRIVFARRYAHDTTSSALWLRAGRDWVHLTGVVE